MLNDDEKTPASSPSASALKLAACPEQSVWHLQSLSTVAASDKVNKPHTGTFFPPYLLPARSIWCGSHLWPQEAKKNPVVWLENGMVVYTTAEDGIGSLK